MRHVRRPRPTYCAAVLTHKQRRRFLQLLKVFPLKIRVDHAAQVAQGYPKKRKATSPNYLKPWARVARSAAWHAPVRGCSEKGQTALAEGNSGPYQSPRIACKSVRVHCDECCRERGAGGVRSGGRQARAHLCPATASGFAMSTVVLNEGRRTSSAPSCEKK
jgi:hypothetical protein